MKTALVQLLLCTLCIASATAKPFSRDIGQVFDLFCAANGFEYLQEKVIKKKINEKQGVIELIKNCEVTQFCRFTMNDGKEMYVFANYKSPVCAQLVINQGCYKFENGNWTLLNNVLPNLKFFDFYGFKQKPPVGFENIGTTTIHISKNKAITLLLEQNWISKNPKKERILNQAMFTAVRLKWSKKEGRFKIKKWIR